MNESRFRLYQASLFRLSRTIGLQFQQAYPNVQQLGVDVAVSRDLKPWIREVNTNPAVTPFIALGNKRMYRRIVQLNRLHGRQTFKRRRR
jgi:hypothetical protein